MLRAPIGKFEKLRRGATLISMLHFPTRPARVRHLEELGIDAVSLDTIEDDEGRRLVVNSTAVAWNGLEAAFETLERPMAPAHLAGSGPRPGDGDGSGRDRQARGRGRHEVRERWSARSC